MKRIILAALAVFAIAALPAAAGGNSITLTTSPNPVTVGSTFGVYMCGTQNRYLYLEVTAPSGAEESWEVGVHSCNVPANFQASEVGTYTVTICKWSTQSYGCVNDKILASTTETVLAS